MPLAHRRNVTPRLVASNRRNAQKSTGPRTARGKRRVAMNALKHGGYSHEAGTPFRDVMLALREDPREFDRLHEDLTRSWKPANTLESLLVRDLAKLYWRKLRAERVFELLEAEAIAEARDEQEKRRNDAPTDSTPLRVEQVREHGYREARDCTEKFEKCLGLLDELAGLAGRRANWKDAAPSFHRLYGVMPSAGTAMQIDMLWNPNMQGESNPETTDYETIREFLSEDRREVQKAWDEYKESMSRVESGAKSEPADDETEVARVEQEWSQSYAGDAALDRRINNKIRLLKTLKSSRPAKSRRARRRPSKTVDGGRLRRARRSGSNGNHSKTFFRGNKADSRREISHITPKTKPNKAVLEPISC
jgi:hypothetical protein